MRLYISDLNAFFRWMQDRSFAYVVLRGHRNLGAEPKAGTKDDVDMLVEDRAVAEIQSHWRGTKRKDFKCDLYSESGAHGADYLGHAYLPAALATRVLRDRVLWQNEFSVPCDRDLFWSLLYHVCYQKGERVLDSADPETLVKTKYHRPLEALANKLDLALPLSLDGMHQALVAEGYGIDYPRLARYSQNEFRQDIKSAFYADLARALPGELNLFVLRSQAVRKGYRTMLLEELGKHYQILAAKDIPWLKRWSIGKCMRGNKWRWGGRPAVAVVVFDPSPIERSIEDRREKHPLVFNARQFFKGELRERIIKQAGFYHKVNALHSTDNEAEAIGHMQLFFTADEEKAIYQKAGRLPAS